MTDKTLLAILAVSITFLWCIAIVYDSFVGALVALGMSWVWVSILGDHE
jgi:hypothetical protein